MVIRRLPAAAAGAGGPIPELGDWLPGPGLRKAARDAGGPGGPDGRRWRSDWLQAPGRAPSPAAGQASGQASGQVPSQASGQAQGQAPGPAPAQVPSPAPGPAGGGRTGGDQAGAEPAGADQPGAGQAGADKPGDQPAPARGPDRSDEAREAAEEATGVIVIDRASKIFPHPDGSEVQALAEVSLTVGAGEFVSLIGPSGCGKSTLLRLIAGLETATGGRLELDGRAIEGPDAERGLVFQNPFLFPWLNVNNNVAFGLRARRVYRRERAEVARYLELVGLGKFGRVYPHHLSGGMAQRASLARALINKPRVLLLDEPLGALDAFTRMNMQDEILRIREDRRVTMIMVTHDVDEAIYLSDRIVVMTPQPGRVETILAVPFARPRARGNPGFLHLRSRILEILNFAGHVDEPAYQI